jgi:hypothetical protein
MTDARPYAGELVEVKRNPWIMGLAATPFLATLLAVVANTALFVIVPHLAILGLFLTFAAWRRNWRPVTKNVRVRADAKGVHVGARFVPRSTIRSGLVVPGAAPRVLLRRRFALPIELQTSSKKEARGLLRALGLDVSQSVATFTTLSRAAAKRRYGMVLGVGMAACFLGFVRVLGPHPSTFAFAMLGATILAGVVLAVAPTRLDVGADGIALRWLGRTRFIAYEDIEGVARYARDWGRSKIYGLSIVLRSAEEVLVPISMQEWGDGDPVSLIEERIEEAMHAFRKGGAAADAALLRRGERAMSDWISALRSLGAGANADLRTAPVPRDRLFRIVEDPAAAPADRAAAAVALGGDLDDDGRARLKAVAEATAAPRLRIAIEKAATEPDGAALEEALAALEVDEEKAHAQA